MKVLKNYIIITIVLLIALEFFARCLLWSFDNTKLKKNIGINYSFSLNTIGDIKPSQKGYEISYNERPFFVKINDEGFRSNSEYCKDCNKIFLLGDSQTFGLYLNQDDIISEKLQNRLNYHDPNLKVYNAGITGAEFDSVLSLYKDKFYNKISNSIIIYMFSYSDVIALNKLSNAKSKRQYVKEYQLGNNLYLRIKKFIRDYSGIYNFLNLFNSNGSMADVSNSNYEKIKTYKEININAFLKFFDVLDDFQKLVSHDNNKIIFAYHPEPSYLNTDLKIENFNNLNLNFIDLTFLFKRFNKNELFHFDEHNGVLEKNYNHDSHLTRFSNLIISEFLSEYLIKNNYIIAF